MSILVRQLTGADAYRDLRLAGLKSDPRAFGSDHATESGWTIETYRERLETSRVFGAVTGQKLIGSVGYHVPSQKNLAHRGHVWGMIVAPAARGQGAGKALLSALVQDGRARGLRQLHLGVGAYNTAAIHLYTRLGFCTYGTEPRALHIDNQDIDEHLMVLFLDKED